MQGWLHAPHGTAVSVCFITPKDCARRSLKNRALVLSGPTPRQSNRLTAHTRSTPAAAQKVSQPRLLRPSELCAVGLRETRLFLWVSPKNLSTLTSVAFHTHAHTVADASESLKLTAVLPTRTEQPLPPPPAARLVAGWGPGVYTHTRPAQPTLRARALHDFRSMLAPTKMRKKTKERDGLFRSHDHETQPGLFSWPLLSSSFYMYYTRYCPFSPRRLVDQFFKIITPYNIVGYLSHPEFHHHAQEPMCWATDPKKLSRLEQTAFLSQ